MRNAARAIREGAPKWADTLEHPPRREEPLGRKGTSMGATAQVSPAQFSRRNLRRER
jgi:hypothetical protein